MLNPMLTHVVPTIALMMMIFTTAVVFSHKKIPELSPTYNPPMSNIEYRVAGVGIIEAKTENIYISTQLQGVVKKVLVNVNDNVTTGQILCEIDDSDLVAENEALKASLNVQNHELNDMKSYLKRYTGVSNKKAIRFRDLEKIQFDVKKAEERLKQIEANIKASEIRIEKMKIKSPIDGVVLKSNPHEGEYYNIGANLFIVGKTQDLNVRVSFDESDALRIKNNGMSEGIIHGYYNKKVKLKMLRKEPFFIPKKVFTGDIYEKADTRVQEIIYSFDNSNIGAYVGQQMDVYVEAKK